MLNNFYIYEYFDILGSKEPLLNLTDGGITSIYRGGIGNNKPRKY